MANWNKTFPQSLQTLLNKLGSRTITPHPKTFQDYIDNIIGSSLQYGGSVAKITAQDKLNRYKTSRGENMQNIVSTTPNKIDNSNITLAFIATAGIIILIMNRTHGS